MSLPIYSRCYTIPSKRVKKYKVVSGVVLVKKRKVHRGGNYYVWEVVAEIKYKSCEERKNIMEKLIQQYSVDDKGIVISVVPD